MSESRSPGHAPMEFQRENLWVGLFVIVALLIFTVLAALAVHKRFFRREYVLHTSLPRIEGLQPGADVVMRGHVVGLVRNITLTTTPAIGFDVDFGVADEVRLPVGTRARLSGGFGSTVLDLVTPGDEADPDSPPALPPEKRSMFLEPDASVPGFVGVSLEALFTDAYAMIGQLSSTLSRTDALISERLGPQLERTVEALTGDLTRVIGSLEATLARSRRVLDETGGILEESRPRVATLLETANRDLEEVERIAGQLGGLLAGLDGRMGPLLDDVGASARSAGSVLEKVDRSLDEEKIRAIIDNLLRASSQAEALMEELKRRPWRLFRRVKGEKQELVEELEARREAEAMEKRRRMEAVEEQGSGEPDRP